MGFQIRYLGVKTSRRLFLKVWPMVHTQESPGILITTTEPLPQARPTETEHLGAGPGNLHCDKLLGVFSAHYNLKALLEEVAPRNQKEWDVSNNASPCGGHLLCLCQSSG